MYRLGALLLLAWGLAATTQAETTTLTLACKGTTTQHTLSGDEDPQPISMGIIVNLTDRTVQGFGFPFDTKPLEIGYVNDVEVRFGGNEEGPDGSFKHSINGSINRVTGDVEATWSFVGKTWAKGIEPHMSYALQCKPTQRMF
jgi:hypothetical protein